MPYKTQISVYIAADKSYTVILMMRGGIDMSFLKKFDFGKWFLCKTVFNTQNFYSYQTYEWICKSKLMLIEFCLFLMLKMIARW